MRAKVNALSDALIGVGVLAVSSRRWSASLLASALGMGLFIGIAFSPGTDSVGALTSQVIAVDDGSTPSVERTANTSAAPSGNDAGTAVGDAGGGSTPAPLSPSVPAATTPSPETEPEAPPAGAPPRDSPDDDGGDDDEGTDPFTLSGIVVSVNPVAESYALAVRGELYGIHTTELPDPGDRLEVPNQELANGTYAEDGERVEDGTAESSPLNGFVTYVSQDPLDPVYTLSARGVSVTVRLPGESEPAVLPKLGAFVSVDAAINAPPDESAPPAVPVPVDPVDPVEVPTIDCVRDEPGEVVQPAAELVQKSIEPTGDEFTYFDLTGIVQAVCPATGEFVISADGIRQSGADLTLVVPKGFDLDSLEVDHAVLATAELAENGTLSAAGIASDDGERGADDAKRLQGDFAGS